MTPSPACIAFIKEQEDFRSHPYYATQAEKDRGILSIGYGETEGVTPDMVWTEAQASARLTAHLTAFAAQVTEVLANAPTLQYQFDAMTSLAYNIGIHNFIASSVLTNHRVGHYSTAALAFGLWNKQWQKDGTLKVLSGLTARRASESLMYQGILE